MDRNVKILVVDDDEAVRSSYRRSLDSTRCSVEVAFDGDEALQAMEEQPFDVVLLDLRMPGRDGMSVLRTIKERWPESEVVIITGYPTLETAKEAIRQGAYGYLCKPVGPDDVVNVACGAVNSKRWALQTASSTKDDGAGAHSGQNGPSSRQVN
jgi:DNA-binding NtrC family response regulator